MSITTLICTQAVPISGLKARPVLARARNGKRCTRLSASTAGGISSVETIESPAPNAPESSILSESYTPSRQSIADEIIPLLKFAIPTLCIAITSPIMSLVDTSMVGLYSQQQLAAMAPAVTVADGTYYIMTFIPMAVTNFVALNMARKNYATAGVVVSQALAFAASICLAIAIGFHLGVPNMFTAMGLPSSMVQTAAEYVRICSLGLPFAVCNSVMQAFFLACRVPTIPMLATVSAGVINLVGDLILCRLFSFGAAGAAAATSAANFAVFFFLVHMIRRKLPEASTYGGVRVPVAPSLPHLQTAKTFVTQAGPIMAVLVLKVTLFSMIATRAASISTVVAAGHRILFGHAMLLGIFGDTICQAAQAFLPPRIGSPKVAWRLMYALACCAAIVGVFNATFGVTMAYVTLPLFTASAEVAAVAAQTMPLLAVFGMLHALSMGTEGILLASRDTWFLVLGYSVSLAVLKVIMDCAISQGYGLAGCWIGAVGFMIFRITINSWRLFRPKSVLSSQEPLTDNVAALESQAKLLVEKVGSMRP